MMPRCALKVPHDADYMSDMSPICLIFVEFLHRIQTVEMLCS